MSQANSTLTRLITWFGERHRTRLLALLTDYRTTCPTKESGLVEDLAWAVHVGKGHVTSSHEERLWASRLLDRVGVSPAHLASLRCPESRCDGR